MDSRLHLVLVRQCDLIIADVSVSCVLYVTTAIVRCSDRRFGAKWQRTLEPSEPTLAASLLSDMTGRGPYAWLQFAMASQMSTVTLSRHTHTHLFNGPFLGLPRWAGTRKVKPIWILLKQETVSGSGISWAICKSAPRSRQITTPIPHHSVFFGPDALPAAQPTASKHWVL